MSTGGAWNGRTVLVTGAAGFVGSWLAGALVERGARVTVLTRDDPSQTNFEFLGLRPRTTVVQGSVTDAELMTRIVREQEISLCFHLAAQALVGDANHAPALTFDSNIRGTWAVLEACRTAPQRVEVVVASSDKAYGTQPELPYREDQPLLATNPYDLSKACADLLARSYFTTFALPVAVTRCANIYGEGDINFSRLVPGTFKSALRGDRPRIRSDGSPTRDYIHVDDAVRAYLALADGLGRPGIAGRAFNFGSGTPISVLEMTRRVLSACDRADLEPLVAASDMSREISSQSLDSSAAAAELGWQPQVPLADGLQRAKQWYAEHVSAEGAPA